MSEIIIFLGGLMAGVCIMSLCAIRRDSDEIFKGVKRDGDKNS